MRYNGYLGGEVLSNCKQSVWKIRGPRNMLYFIAQSTNSWGIPTRKILIMLTLRLNLRPFQNVHRMHKYTLTVK